MRLAVVLILVGVLVPGLAWLLRGDGSNIVLREPYEPPEYISTMAAAWGRDARAYARPAVTVPLRYVLAGALLCVASGVFVAATARSRFVSSQDTTA